jgi:hypothetical protein
LRRARGLACAGAGGAVDGVPLGLEASPPR